MRLFWPQFSKEHVSRSIGFPHVLKGNPLLNWGLLNFSFSVSIAEQATYFFTTYLYQSLWDVAE